MFVCLAPSLTVATSSTQGEGPNIRPGDLLISGSADMTARSWRWVDVDF